MPMAGMDVVSWCQNRYVTISDLSFTGNRGLQPRLDQVMQVKGGEGALGGLGTSESMAEGTANA